MGGGFTLKNPQTSERVQRLIRSFRLELLEPACIPGADTWNAKARLEVDISRVLPYLNAELKDADYDHNAKVLIWKEKGKKTKRCGDAMIACYINSLN